MNKREIRIKTRNEQEMNKKRKETKAILPLMLNNSLILKLIQDFLIFCFFVCFYQKWV